MIMIAEKSPRAAEMRCWIINRFRV